MEAHRASKAASPHPRAVLPACSNSFLTCPEAEASNYFHLHQEKYFLSHKQSQHFEKKKPPGGFPVLDDLGGSASLRLGRSHLTRERCRSRAASLVGVQGGRFNQPVTASAETEALAGSRMPSNIRLLSPLKAD